MQFHCPIVIWYTGFLGEFIVSSFMNSEESLSKAAMERLNRWLIGGDVAELRAMEPALQQGVRTLVT